MDKKNGMFTDGTKNTNDNKKLDDSSKKQDNKVDPDLKKLDK